MVWLKYKNENKRLAKKIALAEKPAVHVISNHVKTVILHFVQFQQGILALILVHALFLNIKRE